MMDSHQHVQYTIHMQPTGFWRRLLGIPTRLVVVGVGSSLQGAELLIKTEHETFYSVNYARVLWMKAEVIEGHG